MSKKVQYANHTIICSKENLAEIMINFYCVGPVFDPVTLKELDPEARNVSNVVMTMAAAENLLKALSRALQTQQDGVAPPTN